MHRIVQTVSEVVLGKEQVIKLAAACLLARGHLLLEDIPGIGKTTLALSLARVLGLSFGRIQFTSDLMPADITGTLVFNSREQTFTFRPGPIFRQLILADEINRATPKTQSALLESMGEGQVSVEGKSYALKQPFFVIATQNPLEQYGTFPLPESQLDRFMMSLSIDYPSRAAEKALLNRLDTRRRIRELSPVLGPEEISALQDKVQRIKTADPLIDYVLDLVAATRRSERLVAGLSPRASEALVMAAKAWAFLEGRDYCVPEDVQAVLGPVAGHRLAHIHEHSSAGRRRTIEDLLEQVPVP
jgi:MoxR-like ATPase